MNKKKSILVSIFSFSALLLASLISFNNPVEKAKAESSPAYTYATTDLTMNSELGDIYANNWVLVDDAETTLSEYSSLSWNITSARRNGSNDTLQLTCGIEDADDAYNHSIASSTDESSDDYKIASLIEILGNDSAFGMAMYTNDYIEVSDFQFSLSGCETGYFSVIYQVEEESAWTILKTIDGEDSVFAYNVNTYTKADYISWPLIGKNVRFGFVYRAFNYVANYLTIDNIVVNRTNSIASYMDVLSNTEGICNQITDTATKINKYFSMLTHTLSGVDSSTLMSVALTGTYTSETTALGLLNYLLTLSGATPLSVNYFNIISNNSYLVYFVIAIAAAFCVLAVSLIYKRKHR
ncbi:MAG: hypothetical protein ACI31G_05140 [Bacilli bacterium]